MKTKKLFILLGLGAFVAGAGGVFFASTDAFSSVKSATSAGSTAQKKRCEKCKRGADGKMECTVVDCPK